MNGVRKVAAGLRPFGESVWPGVRNDLFVAHVSIYEFAARFAAGADVLDAGCGTGYGARILARSGASRVLGVDIDALSVSYARRHFSGPGVTFSTGDCQTVAFPRESFDLVVASNVLEHLEHPETFARSSFEALRPGGRAILAVPPITSPETAALHADIHYHRSNLTVDAWYELLSAPPWVVTVHAHEFVGPGPAPDFSSPFPSVLSTSCFAFREVALDELRVAPTLTALFLAARPPG